MPRRALGDHTTKISAEFQSRLDKLQPRDKIRAILMLRTGRVEAPSERRSSRRSRLAQIERFRESARPALREIDRILERLDGRRLALSVDALGTIPVEATPAAIAALASVDAVKAVLEDQPISSLRVSGR